MSEQETDQLGYNLFLRVADVGAACLYLVEHWFEEQPEPETVVGFFEAAKEMFALLYPDADAADYSVELWRRRPPDATVKR